MTTTRGRGNRGWGAALVLLASTFAGCGNGFEKVPPEQVDEAQRLAAEQFASTVLRAWDQGQTAEVMHLLSEEMQAGFTSRKQRGYAADNRELLGAFRALRFVELQRSTADGMLVYRFRGSFEKRDGWEVRVVYDVRGRVAGFWAKPWRELL